MGNGISWPSKLKIFSLAGGLLFYLSCYVSLLLKNSGLAEQPNFYLWRNKDGEVVPSVTLRVPQVQAGVTASGVFTMGVSHTLQNDTLSKKKASRGGTRNTDLHTTARNDRSVK